MQPAASPILFSIVIVNYNGGEYLQAAVDSVRAQSEQNFELIIIDNASTDGSIESLDISGLSSCEIIQNTDNLGFAVGNNIGAKQAVGQWLVLLNPDAHAEPNWLETLRDATIRYDKCRVFASAQYDASDPSKMDGAGDAYLAFGYPWRGGYGRAASEMPDTGLCFSGCGAGAMYERQLFLDHDGFDERFFCYCEDVDLGFRLQLAGERCIFLRDAIIHHHGSGISGKHSEFSIYHGTRNRFWAYVKNMPFLLLLLTLPVHIALSTYLLVRSFKIKRFRSTAKGMWHGLVGAPALLMSSKWRTKPKRASLAALSRQMAWNPWRMSQRRTHVRQDEEELNTLRTAIDPLS